MAETGTRQFTDKTIHRHGFRRQFTDTFEDSSPTLLQTVHQHMFYVNMTSMVENITVNYEELWTNYDLK